MRLSSLLAPRRPFCHINGGFAMRLVKPALPDSSVFSLVAAPIGTIALPTLFRSRTEPLVQLLDHPPGLRPGGFGLLTRETQIFEGKLRQAVIHGTSILQCWPDGTLIYAVRAVEFLGWGTTRAEGPLNINPLALV